MDVMGTPSLAPGNAETPAMLQALLGSFLGTSFCNTTLVFLLRAIVEEVKSNTFQGALSLHYVHYSDTRKNEDDMSIPLCTLNSVDEIVRDGEKCCLLVQENDDATEKSKVSVTDVITSPQTAKMASRNHISEWIMTAKVDDDDDEDEEEDEDEEGEGEDEDGDEEEGEEEEEGGEEEGEGEEEEEEDDDDDDEEEDESDEEEEEDEYEDDDEDETPPKKSRK